MEPMIVLFFGSSVFALIMLYFAMNLAKDKEVMHEDDGTEFIREKTQHRFLQFILIGLFILSMLVSGFAVFKASTEVCSWNLVNETTTEIYQYGNNFTGYHWDSDTSDAPVYPNPNDVPAYVFHRNITKTNQYDYECRIVQDSTADNYLRLNIFGLRFIGFYIVIVFFVSVAVAGKRLRKQWKEKNGR